MEKVTIELTPQECTDVYRCIQKEVVALEEKCRDLDHQIDRVKNIDKLNKLQDDFDDCNTRLVYYKTLMKRFKKIWI